MNITKNIQIIDLALYLPKHKTLIISDIHIGYEEALNKKGILIPRHSFKDRVERLNKILAKVKVKTVIINGDLKHEFGRISEQEWRDTLTFLNLLTKDHEVILIKGNHDTILGPIAGKKNLEILDYYVVDDILITHGHKLVRLCKAGMKKTKIIIIGHNHPAITITDKTRYETYKCFFKGKYKDKTLVVMPSFNLLTEGTAYDSSTNSPYIKDKDDFEVYVVGDRVYYFGKYKDLEK